MAQVNPMFDVDMTKFMGQDMTKMMAQFKMPQIDADALMVAHRKNIEALTAANQCAIEGMSAIVRRQSEIARDAIETLGTAMRDLMGVGSAEEKAARQAEMVKNAYATTVNNMRELTDLAVKTRDEAFSAINKRVTESLDEVQTMAKTGTKPATITATAKV